MFLNKWLPFKNYSLILHLQINLIIYSCSVCVWSITSFMDWRNCVNCECSDDNKSSFWSSCALRHVNIRPRKALWLSWGGLGFSILSMPSLLSLLSSLFSSFDFLDELKKCVDSKTLPATRSILPWTSFPSFETNGATSQIDDFDFSGLKKINKFKSFLVKKL